MANEIASNLQVHGVVRVIVSPAWRSSDNKFYYQKLTISAGDEPSRSHMLHSITLYSNEPVDFDFERPVPVEEAANGRE